LVQVAALSDKPVWKDQGSGGNLDVAIYNITPSEHEAGSFLLTAPADHFHCTSSELILTRHDTTRQRTPYYQAA
jgi:hypothetical protein